MSTKYGISVTIPRKNTSISLTLNGRQPMHLSAWMMLPMPSSVKLCVGWHTPVTLLLHLSVPKHSRQYGQKTLWKFAQAICSIPQFMYPSDLSCNQIVAHFFHWISWGLNSSSESDIIPHVRHSYSKLDIHIVSKKIEIIFLERILSFTIKRKIQKLMSIPCDYGTMPGWVQIIDLFCLITLSLKRKDGSNRCGGHVLEEYLAELAYWGSFQI